VRPNTSASIVVLASASKLLTGNSMGIRRNKIAPRFDLGYAHMTLLRHGAAFFFTVPQLQQSV